MLTKVIIFFHPPVIICFGLKVINGTQKAREVVLCGCANMWASRCPVSLVGGWVEAVSRLLGFVTSSPEGVTGPASLRYLERYQHFLVEEPANRWQRGFNLKILKHCVSSKP